MAGSLTISTLKNDTGPLSVQNGMTGIAKAWASWTGSNGAILQSFNVSSITRNGTGNYTINYTTAMTVANYCVSGTAGADSSGGQVGLWVYTAPTTSSVVVQTGFYNVSADRTQAYVVIFSS